MTTRAPAVLKIQVAGGFGSGGSVEIFDQVFSGTLSRCSGISRNYGISGKISFLS